VKEVAAAVDFPFENEEEEERAKEGKGSRPRFISKQQRHFTLLVKPN